MWGSNGLFDKELRAEMGEVQELSVMAKKNTKWKTTMHIPKPNMTKCLGCHLTESKSSTQSAVSLHHPTSVLQFHLLPWSVWARIRPEREGWYLCVCLVYICIWFNQTIHQCHILQCVSLIQVACGTAKTQQYVQVSKITLLLMLATGNVSAI